MNWPISPTLSSSWSAGYYYHTDPTPDGITTILESNRGNATVDLDGDGIPDDFASRFGILNPIVSFSLNRGRIPVVLAAEYMLNTRAEIDRDQGWVVGVACGRPGNRVRNWLAYYQWQVIEQDAVFSPIAQDDFLLTTNHRSHLAGLRYQALQSVELHLWALVSRPDFTPEGNDTELWRVRLDINTKF